MARQGTNSNAWISRSPGATLTSKGIEATSNKTYSLKFMAFSGTDSNGNANEIGLIAQVLAGSVQSNATVVAEESITALPGLTQINPEAWFSIPFSTPTLNDEENLFVPIRYDIGNQWLHLDHVMLAEQIE